MGQPVEQQLREQNRELTARLEAAEKELLHSTLQDGLTGLPNRAQFMDEINCALARGFEAGYGKYAVLSLDLDRFKMVNDSLTYAGGDQLLIACAGRLWEHLREGEFLARMTGDEFAILLQDVHCRADAVKIAGRILESFHEPFHVRGEDIFVTVSIGIAAGTLEYVRAEDVLRDADIALNRAKAMGKNRLEVYDSRMHVEAVGRLRIESDLRRAIERNEFELDYQPIMRMLSGRIKGFEALIRWRHPERGLVSPAEFVPVAEEAGLISAIGHWVLKEACFQAAEWGREFGDLDQLGDLTVAVNISARQFDRPDLADEIAAILRETKLPARRLILEITESVLMEHGEQTAAELGRLKALGVKLDIDDFGTGYSSLAYLQNFPVDTMKIDRGFIAHMNNPGDNSQIVRAIVNLAHTLKMTVTAEGVETETQLECLRAMACENSQGFLLSRPLAPEAARELLRGGGRLPMRKAA